MSPLLELCAVCAAPLRPGAKSRYMDGQRCHQACAEGRELTRCLACGADMIDPSPSGLCGLCEEET